MHQGPVFGPFFVFIVEARANGYIASMISKAQRIILCDHARLPWRFFGRLTTAAQAGL
jgi:hypothetical protein